MVEKVCRHNTPVPRDPHALNEELQWRRYGRQMLLPEIGEQGQARLQQSRVLIVGLGGLGSPAALYLAAAGVGHLYLSDGDKLEVSNLQRQILYTSNELNANKAMLASKRLKLLNPQVQLTPLPALDADNWQSLMRSEGVPVDLVLDASDNMATRQLINRACVQMGIPLLSAAATGWQGQLLLLDLRQQNSPAGCYHCLYPTRSEPGQNCRNAGILGPVVGIMGTHQALEAIKFLVGIASSALGGLQQFDGLSGRWQRLQLVADPACPVCRGGKPPEGVTE